VPKGRTAARFSVTWTHAPGNPRMVRATLRSGGAETELL
jgi:hypothetical protein